ncbi:hypothetical protein BKA62DRAFT_769234 [Auriculariales sp. MPI-PUGE-AT-0066]|nr:hypothetical protein BKA62DRAFT_769234 [Auriculariales sp. MPI-PUGE-AT-0066]
MSFDIMRELIELEGGSARLLNAEYSPARVIEVLLHAATTNQVGLSAGPSYTPIFELIQCIDSTLLDAAAMAAQAYSTYCMLEELRSKNNVSSLRHTLERAASNWTNALQANPTFALRARYLQRMRMSQQLAAIAMPLEYQLGFKIQIDDLRCKLQAARERLVLFHNNYLQAQNTRGVVSAARQTDAPPMGYQAALPPPLQLPHTPLHQQRQLQQIQWSHQQQQQQRYQPQPSPVQQSGLYAHQPPEPLVQSFGQQFAAHHPTQSSQQPQLPPPLSLNLPQTSSLSSHQAMSSASRVQPPAQVHQPVAAARYSNAQTSSTGASNYTSSSSSSSRQFISHTLASSPMSNSNITVSSSANVHAPQQNLGSQRSEQPHSNQAPPSASTTLLASITPAAGQQAVKQHLLEYARRYLQNSEVTAAQNARPVSTAGAQRQSRQPQPQPQPQPQQMSTSGFPTIPQTYIPPYLPRAPPEPVAGQPPNLRRVGSACHATGRHSTTADHSDDRIQLTSDALFLR